MRQRFARMWAVGLWAALSASSVAVVAAPTRAVQGGHAKPFGPVDLPVWPNSALFGRLQHHQAEASRRPEAQASDPWSHRFADFEHVLASPWRILHEDISTKFVPESTTLQVKSDLTVRASEANVEALDLLVASGEQVVVTTEAGDVLSVALEPYGSYERALVSLPAPLTPDVDTTFAVERTIPMTCDPGFQGFRSCNVSGNYMWVLASYYLTRPLSSAHWQHPYTLHVTAPGGLVVAAPGAPGGPDSAADGQKIWHFVQDEPTVHGGFALAKYQVVTASASAPPEALAWVTKGYSEAAGFVLDLVADVTAFLGDHIVPFPWKRLHLIQLGNNFGGGMAPLSAVFLLRDAFARVPGDEGWTGTVELVAHEVGHQWWGNLVDPFGAGDVALSESLAEYSSCLYTEQRLNTRSQIVGNNLSYMYTVSSAQDRPLGSQSVYSSPSYVQIVYHKGSIVMDMLRRELGDEVMADVLGAFATDFGRDVARLQDLRTVAEAVSGQKLDWFFDQWVWVGGAARGAMAGRSDPMPDGSWRVRLRLGQEPGEAKRIRVPVTVDFSGDLPSEQRSVDLVPDPQTGVALAEWTESARPQRLRPDPKRTLLRAFAPATPGDVNLDGLTDGADLVDLALRMGRSVVMTTPKGSYFLPDPGWNELCDLEPDGRTNHDDLTVLFDWIGTEAETLEP